MESGFWKWHLLNKTPSPCCCCQQQRPRPGLRNCWLNFKHLFVPRIISLSYILIGRINIYGRSFAFVFSNGRAWLAIQSINVWRRTQGSDPSSPDRVSALSILPFLYNVCSKIPPTHLLVWLYSIYTWHISVVIRDAAGFSAPASSRPIHFSAFRR